MAALSALGSEISAGLVTAILIFVGRLVWVHGLRPKAEGLFYQDLSVAGVWEVTGVEAGRNFSEVATVHQSGHRVWGDLKYTGTNPAGKTETLDYRFEGEFRNLILTARHRSAKGYTLDRGAFTLMAKNDGNALEGYYAWYLNDQHEVIGDKYHWVRRP